VRWDAIVVGAGPAGMSAAAELAERGAAVLVIDQQPSLGGQIYRSIENDNDKARTDVNVILGADYTAGLSLIQRLRKSGASLMLGAAVWRIDPNGDVWTRKDGGLLRHPARHIVIACGAIERPVPVRGWTLPGVRTIGALQILLKESQLVPSGKVVLAGTGPLLYLYAAQCMRAGVKEVSILDTVRASALIASAPLLPQALTGHGFGYLAKGLALLNSIGKSGARRYRSVTDIEIIGDAFAKAIRFRASGKSVELPCEIVGLHEGVIPNQQIGRSLDCAFKWNKGDLSFKPKLDCWGETTIANVFIVGDASGIREAKACEPDGTIAAIRIAGRIGLVEDAARDRAFAALVRERASHLSVRPLLNRLYRPSAMATMLTDSDTPICRCENISAAQIRQSVDIGSIGPNQTKAYLRTGMGPCQGRMCASNVSQIIAHKRDVSVDDVGHFRVRSPLVPISAAELAAVDSEIGNSGSHL